MIRDIRGRYPGNNQYTGGYYEKEIFKHLPRRSNGNINARRLRKHRDFGFID